jgi:hypothetical protein
MKILFQVAHQRRPGRSNLIGKTNGWKHILNALTIHYGDRIAANTNDHHDRLQKSQCHAGEVWRVRSTKKLPVWLLSVVRPAGRQRTGRRGLRGAWLRPHWDMPTDRSRRSL